MTTITSSASPLTLRRQRRLAGQFPLPAFQREKRNLPQTKIGLRKSVSVYRCVCP